MKADAQLIARFCQMHRPAPWAPPAAELRLLQALVRRLEALAQMRQMEQNRLVAGVPPGAVQTSLEEHIAYLDDQLARTRQAITEHIEQNPTLKEKRDLLVSIPGYPLGERAGKRRRTPGGTAGGAPLRERSTTVRTNRFLPVEMPSSR